MLLELLQQSDFGLGVLIVLISLFAARARRREGAA